MINGTRLIGGVGFSGVGGLPGSVVGGFAGRGASCLVFVLVFVGFSGGGAGGRW